MVRIGIVSEQMKKNGKFFFGKYTKEYFTDENNPFELVCVSVPYSEKGFEKLSERKQKKVIGKALAILKNEYVSKIIASDFLKEYGLIQCVTKEIRRRMFVRWAYPCLRRVSEKCGISLLDSNVCIRESEWDRISETLAQQLRFDVKRLCICTDDEKRARQLCETVFDETGMHIKIVRKMSANEVDILVDADNCGIRFGRDLYVDGVAGDFNLNDYPVDLTEISAVVWDFVDIDQKISYFSGKKKLTL